MYLVFIRLILMFYILFTSFCLLRGLSSLIFNKNVKFYELFLIPFWPFMCLSEKGCKKFCDSLGIKE